MPKYNKKNSKDENEIIRTKIAKTFQYLFPLIILLENDSDKFAETIKKLMFIKNHFIHEIGESAEKEIRNNLKILIQRIDGMYNISKKYYKEKGEK